MPGKAGCSGRPPSLPTVGVLQPIDTNIAPKQTAGRPPKRRSSEMASGKVEPSVSQSEENKENVPKAHEDYKKKPKLRPHNQMNSLKDDILGKPIDLLPTTKLPVRRLIYQRWRALCKDSALSEKRVDNNTIAGTIAKEVVFIWEIAHIPHIREDKIKNRLVDMIEELRNIMKFGTRLSSEKEPLFSFIKGLDQLFDIAPIDIKQKLAASGKANNFNWENDWEFYLNQSQIPQIGSICGIDQKYKEMEVKRIERSTQKQAQTEREAAREKKSQNNPYSFQQQ